MSRISSEAPAGNGGPAHEFAAATTAAGPSAVTIPPRPVHRSARDHDLWSALGAALGSFPLDGDGQPRQDVTLQEMRELSLATGKRVLAVALDHGRRGLLTADDLSAVCGTAGRVYAPWLTDLLQAAGLLEPQAVTAGVPAAWSVCEFPEFGSAVGRRRWLGMFAAAGFTVDGEPADRPHGTVTLYRGATHARRRGMSWSSDLDVARHFAGGALPGRMPGQVYRLEAPWSAVLAVINDRNEGEHVVDTRGLTITAAGGAA